MRYTEQHDTFLYARPIVPSVSIVSAYCERGRAVPGGIIAYTWKQSRDHRVSAPNDSKPRRVQQNCTLQTRRLAIQSPSEKVSLAACRLQRNC